MEGKIRRLSFWMLDFLKGSPVKKHLDNIEFLMETDNDSIVAEETNKKIKNLLEHATSTVEFYSNFKNKTLLEFPIIDKNIIKSNYNQFLSSIYENKKVHILTTSGSTGVPLAIKQDQDKRNRVYAEMMYFWNKAGYKFGDRYAFLRVWNNINKKSRLTSYARNLIMIDISELDDKNLLEIEKLLKKDKRIKMIIGYASTLDVLADYFIKRNVKINSIETIISGSEELTEVTRKSLEEVFNCNVVSLYSNQENGMLAQECIGGKEFHVNQASYYIEVLKIDSNEPAEVGELGRIVVTDLYNYAMPLIRYDTGDMVKIKKSKVCDWTSQVWGNIEGRVVDMIYSTEGKPLSPHSINNNMWEFKDLKQWQFIQEGKKEYVIKINDPINSYPKEIIVKKLKSIVGNDAQIKVKYVEGIPNLKSGKFKKTICNYDPRRLKVKE